MFRHRGYRKLADGRIDQRFLEGFFKPEVIA